MYSSIIMDIVNFEEEYLGNHTNENIFADYQLIYVDDLSKPIDIVDSENKTIIFVLDIECIDIHGEDGKNIQNILEQLNQYRYILYSEKLKEVGHTTFAASSGLYAIYLPKLEKIEQAGFAGSCVRWAYLPEWTVGEKHNSYEGYNEFGHEFSGCYKLEYVSAKKLDVICSSTFKACTKLKTLDVQNVNKICKEAFARSGLNKLIMNFGIIEEESLAFSNIHEIVGADPKKYIVYNEKINTEYITGHIELLCVINIEEKKLIHLFADREIQLDDRFITHILNKMMLDDFKLKKIGKKSCCCESSVSLINLLELKEIGDSSFRNNDKIQYLYAPNLENVGEAAFQNCSSLKEIRAPNINYIGKYAFLNCTHLSIIQPFKNNMVKIDRFAFCHCVQLCRVDFYNNSKIDKTSFDDCKKILVDKYSKKLNTELNDNGKCEKKKISINIPWKKRSLDSDDSNSKKENSTKQCGSDCEFSKYCTYYSCGCKDKNNNVYFIKSSIQCGDKIVSKHLQKYGDVILASCAYGTFELGPYMHINQYSFCGLDKIYHLILPDNFNIKMLVFFNINTKHVVVTIKNEHTNDDGYFESRFVYPKKMSDYLFCEDERKRIMDNLSSEFGTARWTWKINKDHSLDWFNYTKVVNAEERIMPGTYLVSKEDVVILNSESLFYGEFTEYD